MALLPIIGIAFYAVLISLLQEKLIYMPRTYDGPHSKYYIKQKKQASKTLVALGGNKITNLHYTLEDGTSHTAYFLAPPMLRRNFKQNSNSDKQIQDQSFHLWMAASGNAGLALDWLDTSISFIKRRSKSTLSHGFLLVDYPGYGANSGSPTPSSILESTNAALNKLDDYLIQKYGDRLTPKYKLSYVAHSIGCSAVLQHVVSVIQTQRTEIDRIVLVSPFTTMIEMASK